MNENLIVELKNTINNLKLEIIQKQVEFDLLINQYQELTGIELEDENL